MSETDFDPDWNCPTHFAGGDPACPACIAKQPSPLLPATPPEGEAVAWAEASGKAWSLIRSAMRDAVNASREAATYEHESAKLDAFAAQCANRVLALTHPLPARECVLSDGSRVTYRDEVFTRWDGDRVRGAGSSKWYIILGPTDTGADFDALKSFAAGVGR